MCRANKDSARRGLPGYNHAELQPLISCAGVCRAIFHHEKRYYARATVMHVVAAVLLRKGLDGITGCGDHDKDIVDLIEPDVVLKRPAERIQHKIHLQEALLGETLERDRILIVFKCAPKAAAATSSARVWGLGAIAPTLQAPLCCCLLVALPGNRRPEETDQEQDGQRADRELDNVQHQADSLSAPIVNLVTTDSNQACSDKEHKNRTWKASSCHPKRGEWTRNMQQRRHPNLQADHANCDADLRTDAVASDYVASKHCDLEARAHCEELSAYG
eukprot:1104415-Prymnesium_polylepis.3